MEGEQEVVQDAQPDSSAGIDPNGQPTPPAASQPGIPGQPQKPGPIPYDRFKEVNDGFQAFRGLSTRQAQEITQLRAELDGLKQKSQQQGGLNQTDQATYQQAAAALKDIFKNDPDLKALLDSGQAHQTVQSMREAQLRSMEQQGVQKILKYADDEGIPKDEPSRKVFVKLVESMALTIPQAKERFASGDMKLFDEALELAKPLLAHVKREGQTLLLDTKNKTRQLPTPSRGGAAGPPGLPKLDPNNPRAFESALHKAATEHLNR